MRLLKYTSSPVRVAADGLVFAERPGARSGDGAGNRYNSLGTTGDPVEEITANLVAEMHRRTTASYAHVDDPPRRDIPGSYSGTLGQGPQVEAGTNGPPPAFIRLRVAQGDSQACQQGWLR